MDSKNEISQANDSFICSSNLFRLLGSFCTAVMLFINMEELKTILEKPQLLPVILPKSSNGFINAIIECMTNLAFSFDGVFVQVAIVFAAIFFVSGKIADLKISRIKFSRIFSVFIAIMWTFGKAFFMENDLHLLISSLGQLVKSLMFGFGCYFIMYNLMHLLYYALEKAPDFVPQNKKLKNGKLIRFADFFALWDKHPFAFPLVFLLAVWAPYVIVSYPGNMGYDGFNELCQYFGKFDFTSHHPPIYTLLIGKFVRLGKVVFKSPNVGLFLYTIFQYLLCAVAMAYNLSAMKKMDSPRWLKTLSLFIYGFMPHFAAYVNVVLKDVIYSVAFVVLMTQIILMFVQKKKFWTAQNIIIIMVSMSAALLFRNNGKHVLLPFAVVIVIKFFIDFRKKKISAEDFVKCAVAFILPIYVCSSVTSYMVNKYDIESGSIREALSIPFQQTARYVRDYGDEVTSEEREAIDSILDYDKIGELYDERISDPVKRTFKPSPNIRSNFANYLKVWFKQFFKHPICYFEATLNQNYYIVYPFNTNMPLYADTTSPLYYGGISPNVLNKMTSLGLTECEPLTGIQSIFSQFYTLIARTPFIGLLSSSAFYILLLFCLLIYSINKKRYSELFIISIPLLMSILVIIASPVIFGQPRYAFPISYSMPIFTAFYIFINTRKAREKVGKPRKIRSADAARKKS